MTKISCSAFRRLLDVGTEFTAEYVGPFLGGVSSRRRVAKLSACQMASEVLEGPKQGRLVYLDWRGVSVREEDGGYILTNNQENPPQDFLRVTSIVRSVVAVLALLMLSGCASTRQAIVATWEPMPEARVAYMVEIGGDRQ